MYKLSCYHIHNSAISLLHTKVIIYISNLQLDNTQFKKIIANKSSLREIAIFWSSVPNYQYPPKGHKMYYSVLYLRSCKIVIKEEKKPNNDAGTSFLWCCFFAVTSPGMIIIPGSKIASLQRYGWLTCLDPATETRVSLYLWRS